MTEILFSWLSIPRVILIALDNIAYGLVDNAYNLIYSIASGTIFNETAIIKIMNNTYVVIGIFALFRIAMLLVNAMISPDKLTDKENGFGSILKNLIIMFVFLIFTPMAFREIYQLQSVIVEKNYINKIFLNSDVDIKSTNPGYMMKKTAIYALVHPNYDLGEKTSEGDADDNDNYTFNDACNDKCKTAIKDYYKMMDSSDSDVKFSLLSKYIGTTVKFDEDGDGETETVYVYEYSYIIVFAVGIFLAYILYSFAIDIGVRAVELAVLEILAPLFIVTYIDPKSAKSGPFHKWLTTVGKTFASLFIKLAIVAIMLLLISLIKDINFGMGAMGTLTILIAILIFAKKAPKWIGDMIGVEGGVGELGIGKKLGSAALIGGALTKAGHAAVGAARGAAGLMHKNAQDMRAQRKKIREDKGLTHGKQGRQTRQGYSGGYFSQRKQLHQARKEAYRNGEANLTGKGGLKNALGKPFAAAATGVIIGGKVGLNASDLKGALKDSKGAVKNEASHLAFQKPETKFGNYVRDIPEKLERTFGDPNDLYQRRKDIEDAKNAKFHSGGRFVAGLGKDAIVEGNGDAVKLFKKYGAAASGEDLLAQYCETKGISVGDFNKIKTTLDKDDNTGMFSATINGNSVNLDKELYVSGTGGAENLHKMFNTYQSNALANSSHSQEQYMQQANAYQGVLNTQNTVAQNAQAIASALSSSLPSAISSALSADGIKLDTSSMSGIKNSIRSINDRFDLASADEQKILSQKLSELSKLSEDYDYSEKQAASIRDSIDQLQETITSLKPIVNAIEGSTVTEKEQMLAIASSKLDKVLEGIKKPSEEKK